MKKSGILAASVAAASASVVSSSAFDYNYDDPNSSEMQQDHERKEADERKSRSSAGSMEKFAPRFDGLRFIETLVTAHR